MRVLLVHTFLGPQMWRPTVSRLLDGNDVDVVCFEPPLVHTVDEVVLAHETFRALSLRADSFDTVVAAEHAAGPVARAVIDGSLLSRTTILVDPPVRSLTRQFPELLGVTPASVAGMAMAVPRALTAAVKSARTFRAHGAAAGTDTMFKSLSKDGLQHEWSTLMRQEWERREPFDDTLVAKLDPNEDLSDWFAAWRESSGSIEVWLPKTTKLQKLVDQRSLDSVGRLRWTRTNAPWINEPAVLAAMVARTLPQ